MKKILTYLLFICPIIAFSQIANIDSELKETVRKTPVTFTHQPFLLLKITPTALFESDNVLQFGGEIAPPFGKFSFNFDYGIGSSKWSLNKFARTNFEDSKTTLWRAEIRGYFSDWYPFYSLDKKPFGRYYALELMNRTISRTQEVGISNLGGSFPSFVNYQKIPVEIAEQAINLKFGKHFLINRFLFLDGYVGLGVGRYEFKNLDLSLPSEDIIHKNYIRKNKNYEFGSKGLFLSKTAGVRVCLVL